MVVRKRTFQDQSCLIPVKSGGASYVPKSSPAHQDLALCMAVILKLMKQKPKLNRSNNLLTAVAIVAFIIIVVPLPFKPSIWSFIHRQRLNNTLASFTDPVYIPTQTGVSDYGFQTYLGWQNSYWIMGYSDNSNHTGGYYYIQASKNGQFASAYEGPSETDIEPFSAALTESCEPHDSGIEICQVLKPKHYVAKYEVEKAFLLSDITQKVFNKDKLDPSKYPYPHDYLPPTEAQIQDIAKVMLSAKPMNVADIKKHFKTEF